MPIIIGSFDPFELVRADELAALATRIGLDISGFDSLPTPDRVAALSGAIVADVESSRLARKNADDDLDRVGALLDERFPQSFCVHPVVHLSDLLADIEDAVTAAGVAPSPNIGVMVYRVASKLSLALQQVDRLECELLEARTAIVDLERAAAGLALGGGRS